MADRRKTYNTYSNGEWVQLGDILLYVDADADQFKGTWKVIHIELYTTLENTETKELWSTFFINGRFIKIPYDSREFTKWMPV